MPAIKTNPMFKKLRAITLPVLKIEKGVARYFKFLGPMHAGKKIDDQKDAATLLHSVDLETGEEGLVIAPSIMVTELYAAYPKDSYVGKCFEIILTRVPEKRYNIVSITEVAEPEKPNEADQAATKAAALADGSPATGKGRAAKEPETA